MTSSCGATSTYSGFVLLRGSCLGRTVRGDELAIGRRDDERFIAPYDIDLAAVESLADCSFFLGSDGELSSFASSVSFSLSPSCATSDAQQSSPPSAVSSAAVPTSSPGGSSTGASGSTGSGSWARPARILAPQGAGSGSGSGAGGSGSGSGAGGSGSGAGGWVRFFGSGAVDSASLGRFVGRLLSAGGRCRL